MANMSYCRFENTASDMVDCVDNWDDELEGREAKARRRMLELASDIFDMCGIDYDAEEFGNAIDELSKESA